MKVVSQTFKENIKEMGRGIDAIITHSLDGQDIKLGNEELNSIKPIYQGALLKSIMKELDIDSNVDIPLGTVINFRFGINLDNSEFEYINFGNYIVYSSEKQEDTNSYNIICYDRMLASMIEYEKLQTDIKTFPMTIRDYIDCICADLGLYFKNKNEVFANYNRIIESDLYADLGYTYRDVLDELAQVTASNIVINGNDELEIRYIAPAYTTAEASSDNNNIVITDDENIGYRKITINDKDDIIKEIKVKYATGYDTIDEEYLKDVNVKFGEKYGPINSIVLSRAGESDNVYLQDEESVEKNGLCEIKISENQIMNFNNRSDYLPDILENLNGLEYYINDFTSTGICYYEICDKYNVKIGDEVYTCVMLNDEITIESGLVENIYTDLPEESVTDYTKSDKTDRRINQTYLIVDKQNQTIEGVVSQVDGQNEKITRVEQTVDSISSIVKDLQYDIQEGGFVTQTEMSSAISQSASSINASVSQKITDAEGNILNEVDGKLDLYIAKGDTDEVISALNVAVNQLKINSDNFKLSADGELECSKAKILNGYFEVKETSEPSLNDPSIYIYRSDVFSDIEYSTRIISTAMQQTINIADLLTLNTFMGYDRSSNFIGLRVSGKTGNSQTSATGIEPTKITTDRVILNNEPTDSDHATTKNYVDNAIKTINMTYKRFDFANPITSSGGSQYITLPERTVLIEPLIEIEGGLVGGSFLGFYGGYTYVICNNTSSSTYLGIYCRCSDSGLFEVSNYMHCGKNITGIRAWYL